MNRVLALSLRDLKDIGRDPMLMIAIVGPLLLATVIRFVLPFASPLLEVRFGFGLMEYGALFACLLLAMVPLMLGMLIGLVLLDERDEDLLSYFAVTPLMKKGYLVYRLASPVVLSFVLSLVALAAAGLAEYSATKAIPAVLMLALEAPMFALFMTVVAGNKVEGMAVAKAGGILLLAPFANYFLQDQWQWVGMLLPTYWAAEAFLEPGGRAVVVGFVFHGVVLWGLMRRFMGQRN